MGDRVTTQRTEQNIGLSVVPPVRHKKRKLKHEDKQGEQRTHGNGSANSECRRASTLPDSGAVNGTVSCSTAGSNFAVEVEIRSESSLGIAHPLRSRSRVAVVGSGIIGLCVADELANDFDVHVISCEFRGEIFPLHPAPTSDEIDWSTYYCSDKATAWWMPFLTKQDDQLCVEMASSMWVFMLKLHVLLPILCFR